MSEEDSVNRFMRPCEISMPIITRGNKESKFYTIYVQDNYYCLSLYRFYGYRHIHELTYHRDLNSAKRYLKDFLDGKFDINEKLMRVFIEY